MGWALVRELGWASGSESGLALGWASVLWVQVLATVWGLWGLVLAKA